MTIAILLVIGIIMAFWFIFLQYNRSLRPSSIATLQTETIKEAAASIQSVAPVSSVEVQAELKKLSSSGAMPASKSQIDEAVLQLKNN